MINLARKNALFIFFLAFTALVFLPKLFLAGSALYTSLLTEKLLTYIGSISRLLFLLVGFLLARCTAAGFEKDNPVRPAWRLLEWGLLSYLLGQSVLAVYLLALSMTPPYPSLGDLFFLLAMLLWLLSLASFVHAYTQVGFMEGSIKRALVMNFVLILFLLGLSYGIFIPFLAAPAPFAEKALNIAYPALDLLLLIPVLVLFQMALKLRGGKLWQVWMALLVGFICLTVGDILFAYFTTMEKQFLDPLLDVMFTTSYIFIAWGVSFQYGLLKD